MAYALLFLNLQRVSSTLSCISNCPVFRPFHMQPEIGIFRSGNIRLDMLGDRSLSGTGNVFGVEAYRQGTKVQWLADKTHCGV